MDGRCERHQFEAAAGLCEHCGQEFCSECLVHPFGPKRPPFCIPCTISQSGLRSGGTKPKKAKMSRKERKELAAAGPVAAVATPVVSASAQAMMSASRTSRAMEAPAPEEEKSAKRGRLGRRKGGDSGGDAESNVPTPVAAVAPTPFEAAPRAAEPEEDRGVPEGAGMTAPGADTIDWSKPFEVTS